MPTYIAKFPNGLLLEWSTVVDAPITELMREDEFVEYYRESYGKQGLAGLEERMERVRMKGVSSMVHSSLKDLVSGYNRAGPDETYLSIDEIMEAYAPVRRTS